MPDVLVLFARGFLQVAPVAASTYFVSHDRLHYATVTGFLISFLWWQNAGAAAHLVGLPWALVYASGAALGTWAGQWMAKRLTRVTVKARPPLPRHDVSGNWIEGDY